MKINGQCLTDEMRDVFIKTMIPLERKKEWSQFPVNGKAGAYCADNVNLMNFVDENMEGTRYLEIGTFDGVTLSLLAEKHPDK